MRLSRLARALRRIAVIGLIAVLGTGCGADAGTTQGEDQNQREIAPRMGAAHDAETQDDTATDRDSGTQTPSVAASSTGEAGSGSSDSGAVAPELLEIWYFGWEGSNLSFFQIGLCEDGVATYLFANGPNDANTVRLTGRYVGSGPGRLSADFMGSQPQSGADLHFQLEYDSALDRLHRVTTESDGYSEYGERFSRFAWSEPAATCPTM